MELQRTVATILTATALALVAQGSHAQDFSDRKVELKAGLTGVFFDEAATVSIGGAEVPGGDARIDDNVTAIFEVGYFFRPEVSVWLGLGLPATTSLSGAGSLEAFGHLGDVTYGAPSLTLRYHFNTDGRVSPYLGAGAVYGLILDEEDGALSDVSVDSGWGTMLVAGIDYAIDDRWGAFAEVKKSWLETDTRFTAPTGGGPVSGGSKLTLDPVTLTLGVSYRF
tara:strand:- start:18471 stop:19142 length:672 start_codon:yes stop_codon:yes gene_type:complete